jgi:hypothetical protein
MDSLGLLSLYDATPIIVLILYLKHTGMGWKGMDYLSVFDKTKAEKILKYQPL